MTTAAGKMCFVPFQGPSCYLIRFGCRSVMTQWNFYGNHNNEGKFSYTIHQFSKEGRNLWLYHLCHLQNIFLIMYYSPLGFSINCLMQATFYSVALKCGEREELRREQGIKSWTNPNMMLVILNCLFTEKVIWLLHWLSFPPSLCLCLSIITCWMFQFHQTFITYTRYKGFLWGGSVWNKKRFKGSPLGCCGKEM